MDKNHIVLLRQPAEDTIYSGTAQWIAKDDKQAITYGLKAKDALGGRTTAIAIGDKDPEKALREALAMGCDRGIWMKVPENWEREIFFWTEQVGENIKKLGFWTIWTGCEDSLTDTGQIGPFLGEYLGIPQIGFVDQVHWERKRMYLQSFFDNRYITYEAAPPVLVTCLGDGTQPKLVTMLEILNAQEHSIELWEKENTSKEVFLQVKKESRAPIKVKSIVRTPSSAEEAAHIILEFMEEKNCFYY